METGEQRTNLVEERVNNPPAVAVLRVIVRAEDRGCPVCPEPIGPVAEVEMPAREIVPVAVQELELALDPAVVREPIVPLAVAPEHRHVRPVARERQLDRVAAVVVPIALVLEMFHPAADLDRAAVRLAVAAEARLDRPALAAEVAWAVADLVVVEAAAAAVAVEEEEAAAEVAGVRNHAREKTNEIKVIYDDLNQNFPVRFCDRLRCRSQLDGGDRNEKGFAGNIATKTIQYPERSG